MKGKKKKKKKKKTPTKDEVCDDDIYEESENGEDWMDSKDVVDWSS